MGMKRVQENPEESRYAQETSSPQQHVSLPICCGAGPSRMDETRGIGLHVQPGRREKTGIFKTVKLKAVLSSIFPQKVSSQGETQGQRTPIGRQGINTGKVFTQMAVKERSLDRGQPPWRSISADRAGKAGCC